MKLPVLAPDKKESGMIELPRHFLEPVRADLIKRAALSVRNAARQPYGSKVGAGMRHSVEVSKRRRDYRGSYGHGISRVPRKVLSRKGTRMNWVGAEAPGMRGGRKAHPPKADKIWTTKINKKENKKAIRSAIAATIRKDLVALRGHKIPPGYPFIVTDAFEAMTKTKDLKRALFALGFADELARTAETSIRPGRGKLRGRKTKVKVGPLFVVSKDCELYQAGANLPGIDVVRVDAINADLLAPGTHAGRLTIYSEGAINRLKDEHLFMDDKQAPARMESAPAANPEARPALVKPKDQASAPARAAKAPAKAKDKTPGKKAKGESS